MGPCRFFAACGCLAAVTLDLSAQAPSQQGPPGPVEPIRIVTSSVWLGRQLSLVPAGVPVHSRQRPSPRLNQAGGGGNKVLKVVAGVGLLGVGAWLMATAESEEICSPLRAGPSPGTFNLSCRTETSTGRMVGGAAAFAGGVFVLVR